MPLWFMARSTARCGDWVIGYKWWVEGVRFDSGIAARLGNLMRECLQTGVVTEMIFVHINPSAEPEAESRRMTLLFRELADFLLYCGGFEVQAA